MIKETRIDKIKSSPDCIALKIKKYGKYGFTMTYIQTDTIKKDDLGQNVYKYVDHLITDLQKMSAKAGERHLLKDFLYPIEWFLHYQSRILHLFGDYKESEIKSLVMIAQNEKEAYYTKGTSQKCLIIMREYLRFLKQIQKHKQRYE